MDDFPTPTQDHAFRAVLYPHRSLSPRGFFILMSAVSLVSFIAGLIFYRLGAWPVVGFFGLDVALIYLAFKLNYRSGRQYETVELDPDLLTLTRVFPSGKREAIELNPYWARVRLGEGVDGRTDLALIAQGREVAFGRFLTDDERRVFAETLTGALIAARAAPHA